MKCLNCEKELPQTPGKRAREFCDAKCRSKYWQTHKKPSISELKDSISDIKPAISASECAGNETTTVTQSNPPYTALYSPTGALEISPQGTRMVIIDPKGLQGRTDWINIHKQVDDYCSLEAITPLELIEQHKSFKKELNARKTPENRAGQHSLEEAEKQKNVGKGLARTETSNYFSDYAKRKSQGGK